MPIQPRIDLLSVGRAGGARVRLRLGARVEEASAPDGDESLEAVARTTLTALARLVPRAVAFDLDRVHLIEDDRPVAVALVHFTVGGIRKLHVGAALAADDVGMAVANAVLSALNRRLEVLEL